ncbi:hypothetical protein HRbin20_01067 [bacterium HR20]|nr:hypothetical protein HRbin20_01067 [bacterium HR20]
MAKLDVAASPTLRWIENLDSPIAEDKFGERAKAERKTTADVERSIPPPATSIIVATEPDANAIERPPAGGPLERRWHEHRPPRGDTLQNSLAHPNRGRIEPDPKSAESDRVSRA